MPRISKEAAAAKESFVLGLFAENPTLSMKEVQEKVKAQFGGLMNSIKVNELRARVTGVTGLTSPIVTATEPTGSLTPGDTTLLLAEVKSDPVPETEVTFSNPVVLVGSEDFQKRVKEAFEGFSSNVISVTQSDEPVAPLIIASILAPKPLKVEEVQKVDPVIVVMDQVTDANGTYVRNPKPVEGTSRSIAPGLTEITPTVVEAQ